MSAHYLVTGGAGFVGSHLVDGLLERGDRVTVLDNLSTGKRDNLAGVMDRIELIEGSITSAGDIERALRGVQGVFHLAALPSVARSVEAPLDSHEENVTGAALVLDAGRRAGTKVVYAGSSSAYGDQPVELKHEELRECPLSPYAATKLAGELYCRSFARVYGLPVVVTRFFNVFGPRQVPDSPYSGVVAAFCLAVLSGESPRIDGDGSQSRDFTYVADLVRGLQLAMDHELPGCPVINLACGGRHSVLDLLRALCEYAGVEVAPRFAPPRPGDVRHSQADISRAREMLGFEPRIGFVEGVRRTYDWYRATYANTEVSR